MARGSLFDVPVFGSFIPRINAFPVDREGADLGAMREARDLGMPADAAMLYEKSVRGTAKAWKNLSCRLAEFRGSLLKPRFITTHFQYSCISTASMALSAMDSGSDDIANK